MIVCQRSMAGEDTPRRRRGRGPFGVTASAGGPDGRAYAASPSPMLPVAMRKYPLVATEKYPPLD